MAYPTTYVRIEAGPFRFFTKSCHFDTLLENRPKGTGNLSTQVHGLAGIGPLNGWHWAGSTQATLPGRAEQAAFFMVATAIIVAIEIFTFRTSRGFHIFNVPPNSGTFSLYTRVM